MGQFVLKLLRSFEDQLQNNCTSWRANHDVGGAAAFILANQGKPQLPRMGHDNFVSYATAKCVMPYHLETLGFAVRRTANACEVEVANRAAIYSSKSDLL
jgi:hypothetical protein